MMCFIIIDDGFPELCDRGLTVPTGCQKVLILNFHIDSESVDDWTRRIQEKQGIQTQVIHARRRFHRVSQRVKDNFSELVAKAPLQYRRNGKNLKEVLTFEKRLSLWWLCEISMKNSEAKRTFSRLCQIYVITEVMEENACDTIRLITTDPLFSEVLKGFAKSKNVSFYSTSRTNRFGIFNILHLFWGRTKWFLKVAIFTLMAKTLLQPPKQKRGRVESSIAFFTLYPKLWLSKGLQKDEKYGDIPKNLSKILDGKVNYAYTLASDGIYQNIGIREYYLHSKKLRSGKTKDGVGLGALDRELKPEDIFKSFWSRAVIWKILRLEWDSQFRSLWTLRGVDIYPLIRDEMRMAFRRIPGYLVEAFRVRRFVERYKISCVVNCVFEFCYGRAIIFGAKTAKPAAKVIAMQHGTISSFRLMTHHYPGEILPCPDQPFDMVHNMPQADFYLTEGTIAEDILDKSGFHRDRIKVVGAPRLDDSVPVRVKSRKEERNDKRPRLLFILGLHDYRDMLSFSRPLWKKDRSYEFIFRPHPKTTDLSELLIDQIGSENCKMDYGDVHKSIDQADIVIVADSSAGVEAVIKDKPVICLNFANDVNISPLRDMPGIARFVYDPKDLPEVVEDILTQKDPTFVSHDPDVASRYYHCLDGKASVRAAEAILSWIDGSYVKEVQS